MPRFTDISSCYRDYVPKYAFMAPRNYMIMCPAGGDLWSELRGAHLASWPSGIREPRIYPSNGGPDADDHFAFFVPRFIKPGALYDTTGFDVIDIVTNTPQTPIHLDVVACAAPNFGSPIFDDPEYVDRALKCLRDMHARILVQFFMTKMPGAEFRATPIVREYGHREDLRKRVIKDFVEDFDGYDMYFADPADYEIARSLIR